MGKRFTDTEKWRDPWFRKLSPSLKTFWSYLTDNCDNAGYWKVDLDYAFFHIGISLEKDEILEALNNGKERVKNHGNYWQILDFIFFQFGVLSKDCKPHRSIIELLEKHKNKGYGKGIDTLQEKEKDKEKEKEKEEGGVGETKEKFLDFVLLTHEQHKKLVEKFGADGTEKRIENLNNYLGSTGKKYKSHYHTLLNWEGRGNGSYGNSKTDKPKFQRTGFETKDYSGKL